ncbi:MAG: hypothetical protein ABSA71_15310 [Desulfomonilia bacterium]
MEIGGIITASRKAFVSSPTATLQAAIKTCLNSKIALCMLHFRDKESATSETLKSENCAAFEILTDDINHGVPIMV